MHLTNITRFWKILAIGVIIGLLFGVGLYFYFSNTVKKNQDLTNTQFDKIAIIQAVQKQNRLETITTTVQRNFTITLDLGDFSVFNVPILQNKRQQEISATAKVGAGVDLSKLTEKEVLIGQDGTVNIALPAAEIFYADIVEDKTDLIKDDATLLFQFQIFLNKEQKNDLNEYLLQQVIKQSKQATVEIACADNILQKASKNAQDSVTNLLAYSGIKKVNITTQKASECKIK